MENSVAGPRRVVDSFALLAVRMTDIVSIVLFEFLDGYFLTELSFPKIKRFFQS